MASWSTGLLSIWDDFEVMLNATVLCGTLVPLIPARNALDLNNGAAACGLRHGLVQRAFAKCGCNDRDAAYGLNLALCCCFPPIMIFWRKQMREVYSIDGSILGDAAAVCMCFPCAVMQESRELKKRGMNYLGVPSQISMDSR
jgi:Cys-rich protein (TIGR01571 family)